MASPSVASRIAGGVGGFFMGFATKTAGWMVGAAKGYYADARKKGFGKFWSGVGAAFSILAASPFYIARGLVLGPLSGFNEGFNRGVGALKTSYSESVDTGYKEIMKNWEDSTPEGYGEKPSNDEAKQNVPSAHEDSDNPSDDDSEIRPEGQRYEGQRPEGQSLEGQRPEGQRSDDQKEQQPNSPNPSSNQVINAQLGNANNFQARLSATKQKYSQQQEVQASDQKHPDTTVQYVQKGQLAQQNAKIALDKPDEEKNKRPTGLWAQKISREKQEKNEDHKDPGGKNGKFRM